ncbi:MAG: leucyl aminopeptidase [Actinomycetaceae bacterium]|nr:leucyl aminopeptidase [Actinomycetaceae bacterium]
MTIIAARNPEDVSATSALVVAYCDGRLASAVLGKDECSAAQEALETLGAPSSTNATTRIVSRTDRPRQIIAVFISPGASVSALREAAGAGVRAAGEAGEIVVDFPHDTSQQLEAIAEGAALGAYVFDAYKSNRRADVSVCVATPLTGVSLERVEVLVGAQLAVRDLVNTPARDLGPAKLVDAARDLADGLGIDVRLWQADDLAAEGCGGLLGVGAGSAQPPLLARLDWNPPSASRHVALVGKGITFDSGGMSLKTHAGLIHMKTDMAGAATVAAVVAACARLGLPVRVTAWLCIAENMLSGSSLRVDDVLTIANGTTVEINNTDAEGRLVLADGLSLAVREAPDEVIDVATLTGAQIIALGNRFAGLMGSDGLVEAIEHSAASAGELIWPMPLPAYLASGLDSPVADMRNSGTREAGMLTAGLFLSRFTGDVAWAHIDIAGPSYNPDDAWGYTPKGATGYGVRTLVTHIENVAAESGRP